MNDAINAAERVALARAVTAYDKALLITPDNVGDGWVPLNAALDQDMVFAVRPRPDLLAVDVDSCDEQTSAAVNELATAAQYCGVPFLECASGSPGRLHLWLGVGDVTAKASLAFWCRQKGLDVRPVIRPPGSRHRHNGRATPTVATTTALAVLRRQSESTAPEQLCRWLELPSLSRSTRAFVTGGHRSNRWPSESEARLALATAACGAGYDQSWLAMVLNDPRCSGSASFRARPYRWRRDEVARLWSKAESRVGSCTVVSEVAEWQAALLERSWSGVGGMNALAVAQALGRAACAAGTTTPVAPVDRLAAAAGLSYDGARRALRQLVRDGHVRVLAHPKRGVATRWALVAAPRPPSLPPPVVPNLGADLARWSGIGKAAMLVYAQLGDDAVTTGDIAAAVRKTPRAVRLSLRRLADVGLAVRVTARTWCRGSQDPSVLAVELGVAGAFGRDEAKIDQRRRLEAAQRSATAVSRDPVAACR